MVIGNAEITESKEFIMNRKGEKTSDVYFAIFRNMLLYLCSDASWYANLFIVFHIMKF